ncbi:hypothetical protein niasHT_014945 [Heterodera trifolii]|uniref:Uncharacterized protein n=1 Tax=Heterodera trifolii TaxID=157864 RepID=A0ABD2LGM1_9BILA
MEGVSTSNDLNVGESDDEENSVINAQTKSLVEPRRHFPQCTKALNANVRHRLLREQSDGRRSTRLTAWVKSFFKKLRASSFENFAFSGLRFELRLRVLGRASPTPDCRYVSQPEAHIKRRALSRLSKCKCAVASKWTQCIHWHCRYVSQPEAHIKILLYQLQCSETIGNYNKLKQFSDSFLVEASVLLPGHGLEHLKQVAKSVKEFADQLHPKNLTSDRFGAGFSAGRAAANLVWKGGRQR